MDRGRLWSMIKQWRLSSHVPGTESRSLSMRGLGWLLGVSHSTILHLERELLWSLAVLDYRWHYG